MPQFYWLLRPANHGRSSCAAHLEQREASVCYLGFQCEEGELRPHSIILLTDRKMKKQHDQQLVRMKTLLDSNDDDDMSSTSSISMDGDSDQSSNIPHLMRENERKLRSLSESYMSRFILVGQQLQAVPRTSQALALSSSSLSSTTKAAASHKRPAVELVTNSPTSLNLFMKTLEELIKREEKKRGLPLP